MATHRPILPDASSQRLTEDTVSSWETEKENCIVNISKMHNMTVENKEVEIGAVSQKIDSQEQIISKANCETMCNGDAKHSNEAEISYEEKANEQINETSSCESNASVEERSTNMADTPDRSLEFSASTSKHSNEAEISYDEKANEQINEISSCESYASVEERSTNMADTPDRSLEFSASTSKHSNEAEISYDEKANEQINEISSCESNACVEERSTNMADIPDCSLEFSASTSKHSNEAEISYDEKVNEQINEISSCESNACVEEGSTNMADTPDCSLEFSASTGCGSECATVGETENSIQTEKERIYDISNASTVISEEGSADKTGTVPNCDTPKNNSDTVVINLKSRPIQMIDTDPENQNSKCIVIVQRPKAIVASSTATNRHGFRPLAWDLYDIGFSLVSERVCRDLIHWQVSGEVSVADAAKRQLCLLTTYESKLCVKNEGLRKPTRSCKCGFQSESAVVIAYHSQFGDVSNCDDSFKSCCLCSFSTGNIRSFSRHMKRQHNVKALMPMKATHYQCQFCPCEYKCKPQLDRHVPGCERRFRLGSNLVPSRIHCDLPIFVTDTLKMPAVAPAPVSQRPGISLVSPSADFALPITRFLVPSSINPPLQLPRFHTNVQSEAGSYPPCVLVSSLAPSLPPSGTAFQFVVPQNKLQGTIIVPSSQASFVIPSNLVQNFPHHTVPPVMKGDFPNLPVVQPASLNQLLPNTVVPLSLPEASYPSFLSSNANMPTFLLPHSQSENGRMQVGMHNLAQRPCRSVVTPVIFPSPALPVMSPFAFGPRFPVDGSGNFAGNASPFPNNTANPQSKVVYVRAPRSTGLVKPVISVSSPNRLDTPARVSTENSHSLQFYNSNCSRHISSKTSELVICEICDGFVKDRQSLLVHFRVAHHISLIDSLNLIPRHSCAFCSHLFFTMSGILRHFAKKHSYYDNRVKKFLAKCPLCGVINLSHSVHHMATRHREALILSRDFTYCGICFLNIGDVQMFENHMLTVHSEIFLSRSIILASIAAAVNWNASPSGSTAVTKNKTNSVETGSRRNHGTLKHSTRMKHKREVKCTRCELTFRNALSLQRHCRASHSGETESCPLCLQPVQIGLPYINHVKSTHLKRCSVRVKRILDTNLTNVKEVTKAVLISNSTPQKQNLVDECRRRCVVRITRLSEKKLGIKSKV